MLDTKIIQTRSIFIKIISFLLLLQKFAKTLIRLLVSSAVDITHACVAKISCWTVIQHNAMRGRQNVISIFTLSFHFHSN